MKVLIAVPHMGNIRAELAEFLLSLNNYGHEVKIFLSWGRPISHNRNQIVKVFIESGFDYLLQIDSDISPPKNIIEMVNNNLKICSADIASAKGTEILRLGLEKSGIGFKTKQDWKEGINTVDACGTGCILIHKEVFGKLKKPYFEDRFTEEGLLAMGEDFNFCEKAKESGYDIHYDTRFKCYHYQIVPH